MFEVRVCIGILLTIIYYITSTYRWRIILLYTYFVLRGKMLFPSIKIENIN